MTPPPSAPAQTLDYAKKPSSGRVPTYYLIYTILTMIPVVLALISLMLVTPRFKAVFKDFKTALPAMTEALLTVSDITRSGLWVIPLAFAFLFPILPARITARREPRVQRVSSVLIYTVLMLLVVLAVAVISAVALYLPLVKLVESVSGSP